MKGSTVVAALATVLAVLLSSADACSCPPNDYTLKYNFNQDYVKSIHRARVVDVCYYYKGKCKSNYKNSDFKPGGELIFTVKNISTYKGCGSRGRWFKVKTNPSLSCNTVLEKDRTYILSIGSDEIPTLPFCLYTPRVDMLKERDHAHLHKFNKCQIDCSK